jgi:undecaprenyl-diphosphatase
MKDFAAVGRWLRFQSLPVAPLAALAAALLAWIFIVVGSEMSEGETLAFDMAILRAMQTLRHGHPWVAAIMRDLSGLGSTFVMTLCTTITAGYLVLVSARRMAGLVTIAILSGAVGISLLKATFARVRPDVAFAELVAPGMSFPSGHAGMSAIVFLTLGALLASTRRRAVERAYILGVAALMTLLIGLSRIALGVHWATDVLAGWAFGFGWALAWMLLARIALRGRAPETDSNGAAKSQHCGSDAGRV